MRRLWAALAALALIFTTVPSVAVAGAAASNCESVTGNLVTNCGFETYTWDVNGDAHWTGWADSSATYWDYMYESADAHSGGYSLQAGPTQASWIEQDLTTTAGTSYLLQFYLFGGATSATATFTATLDGTTAYSRTDTDAVLTAWTLVEYTFTASDASTTLRFNFRNDPDYWYLDDVSFTLTTLPNPPTVTLAQAAGQDDPTNVTPVTFALVADQALNTATVAAADFTVGNGTIGTIDCTGTPTTCTIPVTPSSEGAVTIAPSAGFSVANLNGDAQTSVSGTGDRSVTYDVTPPTVVGSAKVKGVNVRVTWTTSETATVDCRLAPSETWTPGWGTYWSSELAKGTYHLFIRATDSAGNTSGEVDVTIIVKSGKRVTPN